MEQQSPLIYPEKKEKKKKRKTAILSKVQGVMVVKPRQPSLVE